MAKTAVAKTAVAHQTTSVNDWAPVEGWLYRSVEGWLYRSVEGWLYRSVNDWAPSKAGFIAPSKGGFIASLCGCCTSWHSVANGWFYETVAGGPWLHPKCGGSWLVTGSMRSVVAVG